MRYALQDRILVSREWESVNRMVDFLKKHKSGYLLIGDDEGESTYQSIRVCKIVCANLKKSIKSL